jgi:hypothetical protein
LFVRHASLHHTNGLFHHQHQHPFATTTSTQANTPVLDILEVMFVAYHTQGLCPSFNQSVKIAADLTVALSPQRGRCPKTAHLQQETINRRDVNYRNLHAASSQNFFNLPDEAPPPSNPGRERNTKSVA